MSIQLPSFSMKDCLNELAVLIDESADAQDQDKLFKLIQECVNRSLVANSTEKVSLYLFQANIFSALFRIRQSKENIEWSWDQPEKTKELLLLRKALVEPGFIEVPLEIKLKIQTNIAGILSSFGRAIEAFEHWENVLKVVPNFAMALGNRALSYQFICRNLYDKGHSLVYLKMAEWGLKDALHPDAYWDSGFDEKVADYFLDNLSHLPIYNSDDEIQELINADKWKYGSSSEEILFVRWCLDNCLFLNPLNDLNIGSIAAKDVFHLPSHVYEIKEPPKFVQYFDLLKQEYVSARAIYYEFLFNQSDDFASKNNLQFDNFDGALYGLRYDKLKLAFRSSYSIFDKVALFINEYFDINEKINRVSFRGIWYLDDCKTLNPNISSGDNWALKSLHSLSQDLYEGDFNNVAQPDARYLNKLRNAAEHRFLSIHQLIIPEKTNESHFHIKLEEFKGKTLRILKLSRAALMYLSFAVRIEELTREKSRDPEKLIPSFQGVPKNPE